MGVKIDLTKASVSPDPGMFLSDTATAGLISIADLKLSWNGKKQVMKGVDKDSGAVWSFAGPDVKKSMTTVEKIGMIDLSEVTLSQKDGGGFIRFTLDGTEKNENGSHPGLTLDYLAKTTWYNLFQGDDRIIGSALDDELYGGDGDDLMFGGAGNDTLDARGGTNKVYGGEGHDVLSSGGYDARIFGGAGNDSLYGYFGSPRLYGGNGNDVLGGATAYANDQMFGGNGHDELSGNYGDDLLRGGKGNDELEGDEGDDRLFGGGGRDTLDGRSDNDVMYGGGGKDKLQGDSGDDLYYGGAGKDILTVEDDFDTAYGGAGGDSFFIGAGEHVLYGGKGADTFKFRYASSFDDNIAVIKDFQDGVDRIGFDEDVRSLDDLTITNSASGLVLETADGWHVELEGMSKKNFDEDDIFFFLG